MSESYPLADNPGGIGMTFAEYRKAKRGKAMPEEISMLDVILEVRELQRRVIMLEYFLLECQPDYIAAQFVAAWSRPGTGG